LPNLAWLLVRSEADFTTGKTALGDLNVAGATIFLKEVVHGGVHRFTVRTRDRELKLRAPDVAVCDAWLSALRAFAAGFAEDEEAVRGRSSSTMSRIAASSDEDDYE
jgi:hypothetical protein